MRGSPAEPANIFVRFLVRGSLVVYGVLLRRYPRRMRERYGREMRSVFLWDLEARVREHPYRGFVAAWTRVLRDLVRPLGPELATGGSPADGQRPRPTPGATHGSHGGANVLRSWVDDARSGWRALRREPAFLMTVALVLGAGIALNAGVFSVVNAYLLRPLPYPEADRVVTISSAVPVTFADAEGVLEKRVSWDLDAFTIVGGSGPQMMRGAWVSPDFLGVYGVRPTLGRAFTAEDGVAGGASVAIISHGLWQTRYGGDPGVLGSTFSAFTSDRPDDAESFTIVGVLPPDFWHFNAYTEVLAPLREDRTLYTGLLPLGMRAQQAAELLTERVRTRATGLPDDFAVEVRPSQDVHVAAVRPTLWTLQAAALLVFLIGCANAAVLLLARSTRRERELSVRRALGAAGGHIVRQLASEGLVIAALAGTAGLVMAWGLLQGVRRAEALTQWLAIPGGPSALRIDTTVLAGTLLLCGIIGVVFGLVPFAAVGRKQPVQALVGGGRSSTDTIARRRVGRVMIGFESALSLALLTGAGLMIRSAINLQHLDLGFEPENVVRGEVGVRQSSYADAIGRVAFFETIVERTRALPSVEAVGMVSAPPFAWQFGDRSVESGEGTRGAAVVQIADVDYPIAMRLALLRGRWFGEADVYGGEEVVVISETLARDLWPGSDAIGQRIRVTESAMGRTTEELEPWARVVGVVRDVRKGVDGTRAGDIYFAHAQVAPFWMNLIVRRRAGAPLATREIETIIAQLDPEVPFATVDDLADRVQTATSPSRFLAALFGGFGALAMLLAIIGMYGVMSYASRQRQKDFAIRMALGASRRSVTNMFLVETGLILGAGLALGAVGGRVLGNALSGQLHGIGPGDPATFLIAAAILGGTALVTSWIPARRAGRMAPMSVLREE